MQNTVKLLVASLFYSKLVEGQEQSTLDVNSDQHSTFMDGDDMIEDLSQDIALENEEKKPQPANALKPAGPGNPLASLLGGAGLGGGMGGMPG